jgi:hypothetical protein
MILHAIVGDFQRFGRCGAEFTAAAGDVIQNAQSTPAHT